MQNARQASRVKQVKSPSSQRKVGCRFMNQARSRLASRPCRNCAPLQHSQHTVCKHNTSQGWQRTVQGTVQESPAKPRNHSSCPFRCGQDFKTSARVKT
ncbi:hypothetical protein NP493_331g06018 [Ridgeia piscesae]|uniref:Uncharacterized protein n=1 Tax=Ridgeia piscesae TaxID=27915 RepID=A0AAD9NUJ3_RIDPI|nr:hypothetical protein NP493_331g06018 [Ridgeia piscesae]